MSGQLGATAGLGIAPDVLKLKARGIYGSSVPNAPPAQGALLPQFLGINNQIGSELHSMLTSGRIKKFGIYIKAMVSPTGDIFFTLRKNSADFGVGITIPQAVSDGTYFSSLDDLDLEFVEGDIINMQLRMVSGTARYFASWSIDIEWDSDSEGEFDASIITYMSPRPILAAERRCIANHSNWVSVDADTMSFPALYSGSFLANAGRVATGFGDLRSHVVRASVVTAPSVRTNKLGLSWIIGETGSKLALGNESYAALNLLGQSLGQSGGASIEPCLGLVVARVNFP